MRFADTSYFLALLNASDEWHRRAMRRSEESRVVANWCSETCPIWVKDWSLEASITDYRWQTEAAKRIDASKALLVIFGKNSHSANGVKTGVQMALQRGKPIP